jgi:hypothetical protein
VAVIRPSFPEDHFTRVPNAWLRDPELPAACKGYLSYLLSHAAGYACSTSQAARDMGANRSTVTAWNAKLVERGYFVAVEQTRDDGRFGANDYTITSCTSARPPLPENPALFPREPAQSTVSGKPRTVEPSRETRHIEEHGEKNTPDPADQGASTDRHLRAVDDDVLPDAVQALASEHYEATGKLGGSRQFLAVRGIVAGAIKAGHAPEQIRPALEHLRRRGRPVTNAALGPLLADPRQMTSNGRPSGAYRDPTDPDAYRGAF